MRSEARLALRKSRASCDVRIVFGFTSGPWVFYAASLTCTALLACSGNSEASDAGSDATRADATNADAPSSKDAGADATRSDADAAPLPCELQGIDGFQWTFEKSLHAPGSCTPEQLQEVITDCLSAGGAPSACAHVNMNCYACVFSSTPVPGVLFNNPNSTVPSINVAGCIQVLEPDSGLSCATALQTYYACTSYACRSCTYTTDGTTGAKGIACAEAAEPTCMTYLNQANTACAGIGADAGAACGLLEKTAQAVETDVGTVLCVE